MFSHLSTVSVIIVCCLSPWSQGEVFTAISDIEPLLSTHKLVVNHIDDLVKREEKKLKILKRKLETYKREHRKAMEDVPNYLGNPINAFTLIKRLTKDLHDIDKIVYKEFEKYNSFNRKNMSLPSEEDLQGAAHALTRLQVTYKLQVKDLAKGLINGIPYSSAMSADDCYEIGRALYEDEEYWNSIDWMKEALRRYKKGDTNLVYSFTEANIYDHVSWAYYKVLDVHSALEWGRKFLKLAPHNGRAKVNEELFLKQMAQMPKPKREEEAEDHEMLCRGDYDVPHEITKNLYCFYLMENHPFLRLAPIKAEQKYANPDVFIYYDVISDREIAHVQERARPKFKRANGEVDSKTGKIKSTYRVCKAAWLSDKESEVVKRISQRIQDFTGLIVNPYTAEGLQIANYGIGGHYLPHYDHTLKGEAPIKYWSSNRIATVLFYLSEVAEGGATVFTELGLSVFPIKHAALVWRNLHPSGEGDLYTRHAACPVLRGSKWDTPPARCSEGPSGVSERWSGETCIPPEKETSILDTPPARCSEGPSGVSERWSGETCIPPEKETSILDTPPARCSEGPSGVMANKWIHQAGQEMVKNARCTLEHQEEEWNRNIPEPILKATKK
ncbi:2OG-Fe(II) oxygenase superfamily domain-containing protein [Phthorimaea operculella]|nr:2OG-Fe(II) oxygenase superfamily domain-containing protein [Phthorimaea operculella]